MPRTARAIEAGLIYHVLNRGNGRMRLFHKRADYLAFERVLAEGLERYPVDLLTYCLMPNHWHLVVRPGTNEALGRWLGWVGVTHVRRHHEHYHSPRRRPPLPRTIQELSCFQRRALPDIVPLCLGECPPREVGRSR